MGFDAHNCKGRLERALRNLRASTIISERNKQAIIDFHNNCFANGVTISRVLRQFYNLQIISKFLGKDFDKANVDDIKNAVSKIERSDLIASFHYC